MTIKITESEKLLAKILILNLFAGIIFFVCAGRSAGFRLTGMVVVFLYSLCCYLTYDRNGKIVYLIVTTWQYTIMIELVYRLYRYNKTPFEFLYILDVLCILFFISLLFRRNSLICKRDPIVYLGFILLLYISFVSIINASNYKDWFLAVALVLRYGCYYLFFSTITLKYHFSYWKLLTICLLAFVLEVIMGFNVDFRNGIFGYDYTTDIFQFVLVIGNAILLVHFLRTGKKMGRYIIMLFITEIVFALMEAKAEVVLIILWTTFLFWMIGRNNLSPKKIIVVLSFVIILFSGWKMIGVASPKWGNYLSKHNMLEMVVNRGKRTIRISDGTNSEKQMIEKNEQGTIEKKLFGIGAGMSIPPIYPNWIYDKKREIDPEIINGFYLSNNVLKYDTVTNKSRVFNRAVFFLPIDIGYLGCFLLIGMYLMLGYRTISILRKGVNERIIIIGAISLWQLSILLYRSFNGSSIVKPMFSMYTMMIFGIVSYEYYLLKRIT